MFKFMRLSCNQKFTLPPLVSVMSNSTSSTDVKLFFKKSRYDGRTKKRKWEERRSDKGEIFNSAKRNCDEPFVRIKKRKYAMILGYSGVDYMGMQRNPLARTIEEDLHKALLKADLISQESYDHMQLIGYQRAARTDKGVSAARQVVSVKLPEELDISKINENLPEVIRVFGIKRVTKGFNSKTHCDGRTYIYTLPTFSFAKPNCQETKETFRLSEEALQEITNLLSQFHGTKNFHNFTCKKNPHDPSAKRFIVSFVCEPPVIRNGVEFVTLKVRGQSFMLHQIRKMVGLTIAVIKEYVAMDTFNKAWSFEKINIPRAPGLGLVLDQVHYDRYNMRYGSDGVHENLEWIELDEEVTAFKEKYILPTIINTEISENVMLNWLAERLSTHRFDLVNSDAQASEDENSSDDEKESEFPEEGQVAKCIEVAEVEEKVIITEK